MKSEMHESTSSLAPVDYEPYLKLLQEVIEQSTSLCTFSPNAFQILSADLAFQVANEFKKREGTRKELTPLFPYSLGTKMATIHLVGEQEQSLHTLGKHIEAIRDLLVKKYTEVYAASPLTKDTWEAFLRSLTLPLTMFDCEQPGKPDKLHYPFSAKQPLSKRRVHVHTQATRPAKSTIRYRGHKLSIKLSQTGSFDDDLIEGFCQLAQEPKFGATTAEVLEMRTSLQQSKQDPTSELARLKKLVKEETLGKLKGEACWRFWSAVLDDMEQVQRRLPATSDQERRGLAEMRRQLRMLTRFRAMLQDPQYADTDFDVRYGKGNFNLRTIFARVDVYSVLPFLVEVVGTLGEVRDQTKDEQLFAYGLRFKLNGPVGSSPSVYQYYAALLDPANDEHKERLADDTGIYPFFADEIIRIAVLYSVLFVLPDDEGFEPYIRDRLIRVLATADGNEKTTYLRRISYRLLTPKSGSAFFPAKGPLDDAKNALESYFRHASVGPTIPPFVGYLVLHNGMLDLTPDRMIIQKRFFRTELFSKEKQHSKEVLRYISVKDALPQQNQAFYALPVQINFEPIYLSSLDEELPEKAQMSYTIDGWNILPVIFVPDTSTSQVLAERTYGKYPRVIIPYRERVGFQLDSPEMAVYRWAFTLLTYLSLDVLWARVIKPIVQQRERLFFPMIRIHEYTQEKERDRGKFPTEGSVIRGLAKTLSHLYSGEVGTLSNTQGFTRQALTNDANMLGNGLSSLYNVLPRIIERPATAPNALDKLAMIIISSRRSDLHAGSAFQRMCVYGEVLFCTRQPDGKLKVEHKTFVVNETSDNVYKTPRTLNDQVRMCVKAGYHHIFYIAKAPYTSHVHFTGKEESEELFFMSPEIIGGVLETFPDVKLYPMFCDQYSVAPVHTNPGKESLYVDDTKELRELLTDPSKSTVVFFNVMNGIQVPTRDKKNRYYSAVVSYATLINMYTNPLYDQPIRNNLLDNREPGSLRKDMLDFLAYVHGVRYEQRVRAGVQLKLDPYDSIIGYDSVGARAIIPSTDHRVQTNLLAFLALVRGRLRRQLPNGGSAPAPPQSLQQNMSEEQNTPESDPVEGGQRDE